MDTALTGSKSQIANPKSQGALNANHDKTQRRNRAHAHNSVDEMKALRRRIALRKHFVRNQPKPTVLFRDSFWSAARPRVAFAFLQCGY
jgi:hypothetical protein